MLELKPLGQEIEDLQLKIQTACNGLRMYYDNKIEILIFKKESEIKINELWLEIEKIQKALSAEKKFNFGIFVVDMFLSFGVSIITTAITKKIISKIVRKQGTNSLQQIKLYERTKVISYIKKSSLLKVNSNGFSYQFSEKFVKELTNTSIKIYDVINKTPSASENKTLETLIKTVSSSVLGELKSQILSKATSSNSASSSNKFPSILNLIDLNDLKKRVKDVIAYYFDLVRDCAKQVQDPIFLTWSYNKIEPLWDDNVINYGTARGRFSKLISTFLEKVIDDYINFIALNGMILHHSSIHDIHFQFGEKIYTKKYDVMDKLLVLNLNITKRHIDIVKKYFTFLAKKYSSREIFIDCIVVKYVEDKYESYFLALRGVILNNQRISVKSDKYLDNKYRKKFGYFLIKSITNTTGMKNMEYKELVLNPAIKKTKNSVGDTLVLKKEHLDTSVHFMGSGKVFQVF